MKWYGKLFYYVLIIGFAALSIWNLANDKFGLWLLWEFLAVAAVVIFICRRMYLAPSSPEEDAELEKELEETEEPEPYSFVKKHPWLTLGAAYLLFGGRRR